MKKTFLFFAIILFIIGSVSAQVSSVVSRAMEQYRQQNQSVPNSFRISSDNRSWQEQLDIILKSQSSSYPNIKRDFLRYSGLSQLPTGSEVARNSDWWYWWEENIMKQAGIPGGFAHVGGKAVDVSVRDLNNQQKAAFLRILQNNGVKVLMEYYDTNTRNAQFDVSIERANLFHCTI